MVYRFRATLEGVVKMREAKRDKRTHSSRETLVDCFYRPHSPRLYTKSDLSSALFSYSLFLCNSFPPAHISFLYVADRADRNDLRKAWLPHRDVIRRLLFLTRNPISFTPRAILVPRREA